MRMSSSACLLWTSNAQTSQISSFKANLLAEVERRLYLLQNCNSRDALLSHALPQGMHCIIRMDKIASLWGEKENIRFGIRTSEA